MRRSFFISSAMPALGLMLMPLMTNAVASEVDVTSSVNPNSTSAPAISAPAIELREGAVIDTGACAQSGCTPDLARERAYLLQTAHPGGTMVRQGPEVALGRLHPEFATRLAAAIREAREAGLREAGVFSAYRPPAFGVGGFSDKFNSLHAYGLAVDMYGIGRPGSSEAKLWTKIAAKHGVVCPYGVNNRVEWNHCQPTRIKVVRANNPLRKTIAAQGPISPNVMFEAGKALIESVASLFGSFTGAPVKAEQERRTAALSPQRSRRVRTADVRQHRHANRKVKSSKAVRTAAALGSKKVRTAAAHGKKNRAGKHAAKNRSASLRGGRSS
jgi:hypothetical protein